MERRKLTKEDIDKVRDIEGFPIGKDEDIIALSDAPYYTACPNPFIKEFIEENGTPYDEETDDYHREPFTADVSEGKHDSMYMAHGYHTKVPFKAIMRYILHYTNPNDIVYDGFCGTGMTGVAAQMCGVQDDALKYELTQEICDSKWGERNVVLSDLSPQATFIAYNYNVKFDHDKFIHKANEIIQELHLECDRLYKTRHTNGEYGNIEYMVWSDVFICPNCGKEIILWDIAVKDNNEIIDNPCCPSCGVTINKKKNDRVFLTYADPITNEIRRKAKQVPVKVFYSYNGKRFNKNVDSDDRALIEDINKKGIPYWYPKNELPDGYNTEQPKRSHGFFRMDDFYTIRNLYCLAKCWQLISKETDIRLKHILMFWFSSIYSRSHKMNRYMPNHNRHVGPLSGTLYVPYYQAEINIIGLLEDKLKAISSVRGPKSKAVISVQSTTGINNIQDNCIDYIFTDPPFGSNLNYSELNFFWESWLKCRTSNTKEAIINDVQHKGLLDYQDLMTQCFRQYYRILKPNRWITVEFHNSQNAVWNSIQESIQQAGFVVADIRTLDKQKGTIKQLSTNTAVKQDLVISAYKPKNIFNEKFKLKAGSNETVWLFINQHLEQLPIITDANNNGKLDVIFERQAYLLFDRMVAYHIINGLSVPMDSQEFYEGLNERFLKRDDMYFLPEQVTEYDQKRAVMDIETTELAFLAITDEKNAIQWLNYQLQTPQSYAELQPLYLQELHQDKNEAIPELLDLLKENFLLNEDTGKWYIPDITKAGDIAKLREKSLMKEFEGYLSGKGKLKVFRSEAIRLGIGKLWKEKNYKGIVDICKRLPEKTIQEDQSILMYYDNSLMRI